MADVVARRFGDSRRGLLFEDREWTWAEVMAAADRRARWLGSIRLDGPFHVGVLMENTPEYLYTVAGAAVCGAVVVGLNPTRRGAELARDVATTNCQIVLVDHAWSPLVDDLDLGLAAERIINVDEPGHGDRVTAAAAASTAGTDLSPPEPDDLFLLIFTSGSTGHPKAVRMSQRRAASRADQFPFTDDDVIYSAMPMFHGNALISAVIPALATGATLALARRFSASSFMDDVRRVGATYFNTVGRAIAHLNATPRRPTDSHHRVGWVLAPETSDRDRVAFSERFGVPIFGGYGSSENAIVLYPVDGAGPGALGTAPPGHDIVVVDPATGQECPTARFDDGGRLLNAEAAIGELVGRNVVSSFEGYYGDPDAEAERTRNGWYWSGDLAYRNADGVFFYAGRTGDWLRVDSENFAAGPVERILGRYSRAREVAVYGVPDTTTGDQVMVALELIDGEVFDPDHFRSFLDAQPDLGPKWHPRYVRVVDEMPATGTDKVDKKPLRATAWRTTDPVWHRPPGGDGYVRVAADTISGLDAALEEHGRAHLLGPRSPHDH